MSNREKRNRSRGSSGNNRKSGQDFLEKNLQKEGVFETDSGLQYQVIEEGEGESPNENSNITIHQRCWLTNSTVIIDTYKKDEPSEVNVEELIEGYQEGILMMNKGARYKFFVPPELGWGKNGSGKSVPPNATIIFDVKLIDFW